MKSKSSLLNRLIINFNYEYDAYGNRTVKEYVGGTLTKTYIWDIINNNVLVETFSNLYQNGYHIYGATGLEATIYPNTDGVTYYIGDLRGSVVTTVREDQTYQPFDLPNIPLISVVTKGEIKSIGLKNKWGLRSKIGLFMLLYIITHT